MANLEQQVLIICVRYAVGGHEYWDNNFADFHVEFQKKYHELSKDLQSCPERKAYKLPAPTKQLLVWSSKSLGEARPYDEMGKVTSRSNRLHVGFLLPNTALPSRYDVEIPLRATFRAIQ